MADNKEKEKYEKVTNLIVKSILALSICFFIIYKLWSIEIKIENFDYLYFLSTVIALFAIVLSVLFYFKSTEQSNQFYNCIFNFIKDTSTLLAEMKKGIGNLEHEVYRSYGGSTEDNDKEKKQLEKEGKKISEEKNKIDDSISKILEENITNKKQLSELKEKILQQSREYSRLEHEKKLLDKELNDLKSENSNELQNGVHDYLFWMLRKNYNLTKDDMCVLSPIELRRYVNRFCSELNNPAFINDARKIGLLNEDNRATQDGIMLLRNYFRHNA